jgi:hypothetical protein
LLLLRSHALHHLPQMRRGLWDISANKSDGTHQFLTGTISARGGFRRHGQQLQPHPPQEVVEDHQGRPTRVGQMARPQNKAQASQAGIKLRRHVFASVVRGTATSSSTALPSWTGLQRRLANVAV